MTELGAVAETALWTLHHRAAEAARPGGGVIADPLAISLAERIDHPMGARFGDDPRVSQWQALRALTFDREVRRFAAAHPGGTVVALGEGLETEFWRVDDGRLRWVTVEFPELIVLRERLLPPSPRRRSVAGDARDLSWADGLDGPVLVTAQGLLMYLERDDALGLISAAAARLPGSAMVFDVAPKWLAERSMRGDIAPGPGGYVAPPWLWGWDAQAERAVAALPGVADLRTLHPPRGRGALLGAVLPAASRLAPLRRLMLSILRAGFAGP